MIASAQQYETELKQLYYNTFYDSKYMYYRGCWGTSELQIPNNNYNSHHFAIVENGEVIGYVTYAIDFASKVANNFGIISFKSNLCFGRDLMKIIDDIFNKHLVGTVTITFAPNKKDRSIQNGDSSVITTF